jgi:hypothetical protein
MFFKIISDILWYLGHIFTGCSILFSHDNYYIALSFVFFGQFITIISRPIGRLHNPPLWITKLYDNCNLSTIYQMIEFLPKNDKINELNSDSFFDVIENEELDKSYELFIIY